jgi:hypothetical protein
MPIPTPKKGQTEQEYVSECISQLMDEYGQEQGSAICYNTYRKSKDMSAQSKIASKLRQDAYKGIDLIKLQEGDGLEDACWPGWKALGTKVLDGKVVPNCIPEEDHPDTK